MTQEFSNDDLTDKELLKKCIKMIRTAVNRGGRLMRGKISEQDVVDIGAIGLALLLRKMPE